MLLYKNGCRAAEARDRERGREVRASKGANRLYAIIRETLQIPSPGIQALGRRGEIALPAGGQGLPPGPPILCDEQFGQELDRAVRLMDRDVIDGLVVGVREVKVGPVGRLHVRA